MNCTAFRAAVSSAVERRAQPDAAAASHLDTCADPECRRCWWEAQLLTRAIAEWRRTCVRVDVTATVLAGWQAAELGTDDPLPAPVANLNRVLPHRRRVASRITGVLAVATLALAVAALTLVLPPMNEGQVVQHRKGWQQAPPPERGVAVTEAQQEHELSEPAASSADEAAVASVGFAQSATSFVTDLVAVTFGDADAVEQPTFNPEWLLWQPTWTRPVSEDLDEAVEPLLDSLPADPHG